MKDYKLKNASPFEGKKDHEVINDTDKVISIALNGKIVDLPSKKSIKVYELNDREKSALEPYFVKQQIWYSAMPGAIPFEKPTSGITEYVPEEEDESVNKPEGEAITTVAVSYGSEFKKGTKFEPVLTYTPSTGVEVKSVVFEVTAGDEYVDLNKKSGEVTFKKEGGPVTIKVTVTDNTTDANTAEGEATFTVVE